ncbi:GRP family sugar transporter [Streptococcus sp. CSL10205-OR2]|uniref:GRP family sugar transporter n=1 Tax=Streptococcus sp. CSL10205-OR2 TaxID=2980558 RepID=UPI0021D7EFEA|nr:GRP family sugar transporter [Streptococcus sp. CSL10205-OR2]MCU9533845.1 GRP family sugar transporter [Streptococcus sp. CSL10205-OR2]
MEGILFALVPMFAWGSIGFVSNKIGGTANQQTFGMTIGSLFFGIVVYLIAKPELSIQLWVFGIIGGILWSLGQNRQFTAMKHMGVSVANPLSSGSQLVFGSLIGAFIFHEWTTSVHFSLGGLALLFLVIGFYFLSKVDPSRKEKESKLTNFNKGFIALAFSTFGYLSYAILFNNIMAFDVLSVILPMAVGMIIGSSLFMKFQLDFSPLVLKNSLVGFMWGFGNLFMLLAASSAGLAIAFSFSQLGAIISIIGGIVFLGEKKTKKEMKWVLIGIFCFLVGATLLGIVKSY